MSASIENRVSILSSTEILSKESTKYYEDNLRQPLVQKGLTHRSAKMFLQNLDFF